MLRSYDNLILSMAAVLELLVPFQAAVVKVAIPLPSLRLPQALFQPLKLVVSRKCRKFESPVSIATTKYTLMYVGFETD